MAAAARVRPLRTVSAMADVELISAGVLAAGGAWTWRAFRRSRCSVGNRGDRWQERRIRVCDGYEPAEIHVAAGMPVRLVFRREETAWCSERVVFPDLGISASLPAFQDTAVELPPSEPGTHPFTCEMQMFYGRLIVDPVGGNQTPAGHHTPTVPA